MKTRIEPKRRMRKPGFEPGLRAWEAPVMTATLLPHHCDPQGVLEYRKLVDK